MRFLYSFFDFSRIVLAALMLCLTLSPAYASRGLANFTGKEKYNNTLTLFPKWTGVLQRYKQHNRLATLPCGSVRFNPCALKNWVGMVESIRKKSLMTQITVINNFFNAVPYITDPVNWGIPDYWETPNEFLDVYGDCEDYAFAKYISLRALGVSSDVLRIMVVHDHNLGVVHSVLAVLVDRDVYILDNQIPRVIRADSIYHYQAIYSINEKAWWRH